MLNFGFKKLQFRKTSGSSMPFLDWVNKNQAVSSAANVPYHLLQLEKTFGDARAAQQNLIIQGDNLQALKALLPFYTGKVKCIFIDPPYNTGSAFEHYDDKLEHSQWLSMMYPRLVLLRELLSNEGSIWVTIDDRESHYLKVLLDEVFGRNNFVRNIVWQKKYTSASDASGIPDSHDHVLVYRKSDKFLRNLLPRTEKQNSLYKYDDYDGRGPWRTDNLSVKTYSENYDYEIINPTTGKSYWPPAGRCWMTSKEKMQSLISERRVFWGKDGKGAPQLKRYLKEVQQGVVPISWWPHDEAGHNDESRKEQKIFFGENAFSTPKPERLLERIIYLASSDDDLILDSFLGSGTTAAVAHKMGRRYIGVEMGDHAQTHCIPRLQKVIEGEQGGISSSVNWQGGGGFSFYTLGEAVFDERGHISPNVRFKALAAYIWLLETKTAIAAQASEQSTPFIGEHEGVAYYLLYNGILGDRRPNGGNVLTNPVLAYLESVHPHAGKKVIFGEASRISDGKLALLNISFKQIPYELHERI
ncbi:site-specific DNA-methyltransferase [Methylophilus sp. VKM B-3414]|uniref:site-specific DNA-methyltransferase n=1 Tax=Methylophilus sp. VKM B-3414 TaxID=3076121 RepID=UPI0028C7860C|nr:site-specific DNA-methyltransferase [Methylophilus sp. VKM B-3414]MDT7849543.1 site-specific DNA-methyltransferase [Methylophilus sp. VKM B-3414]